MNRRFTTISLAAIMLGLLFPAAAAEHQPYQEQRERAQKAMAGGNYQDAHNLYASYLFKPDVNPGFAAADIAPALQALASLNRDNETDAFRERLVNAHPSAWQVLKAVAESYQYANHMGFMIAGEFERGPHRGGGEQVHASERDRVRALQLMEQCIPLLEEEENQATAASVYFQFATMIAQGRSGHLAWKLNSLTDTTTLPDYEPGYPHGHYGSTSRGAPVDAEGNPVFHAIPESYSSAATDGERWRWLLSRAMERHPSLRDQVEWTLANFLHQQFGVQTLADYGWFFYRPRTTGEDRNRDTSGTYELHTLTDQETIARLATGIHRLTLPDGFNFMRLFHELAAREGGTYQETALNTLAQIYANRRQYPAAADAWRLSIRTFGPGHKQAQLNQIIDNWGQFETTVTQPAGTGAVLQYTFRNGRAVRFTARRIRVKRLLDDVKSYLKSNPARLDWQKIQIANLGYRLVQENQSRYLGREVADWRLALQPAGDHFDRRVDVATPLQAAGAYFVTAMMADGNTSSVVVWLNDTVIAKKALSSPNNSGNHPAYYFVADARSGKPIARANVEFFGYWQERLKQRRGKRYANTHTTQFAEYTDTNGQVIPAARDIIPDGKSAQWIVLATTKDGRFAYQGFSSVWHANYHDQQYNQTKSYGITDRPVYRPSQEVQFKWWIRHARYDQEDTSDFANQSFTVRIHNPRGDEVFNESLTTDDYGGLNGEFLLPADAQLGVYSMVLPHGGRVTFRVEEYKKPEFEVTIVVPEEPVMLGEEITAGIQATYYFGAPVTEGTVSYKITRTPHEAQWYPPAPWDWFYGKGYWWFGYDYEWYPGWRRWGCGRPYPFWFPRDHTPPEVVAEGDVQVGEEGTVEVTIDTALAKAVHGDQDHRYQITAEVTDASRRTIVGQGEVLVARKPFKVYAWVDRGHYRTGDTIEARFAAHTLDQKPVAGEGHLTLYRITYDDDQQPIETAVQAWELPTDARGAARQQMKATRAGQYRLSYTVTDAHDHAIEGGYLFVVRGTGDDGRDFRFNHLELVADQPDYAPGDDVNLLINTDHPDSTVVLFVRPSNGVYLQPEVLRLNGKSTVHAIAVGKKDMPNFFVEALTISNGKVHTELREIVVPPEKRVLNVEVLPSAEAYLPGEPATVQVNVTDFDGHPFVGSTVMAVYDKAVEYISGGSNVPGIRDFFWKWRRTHTPRTEHNLERRTGNLHPTDEPGMQPLGVFGQSVADEVGRMRSGSMMMMKSRVAPSSARMDMDMGGMELEMAPMLAMEGMASFDDNRQAKGAGGGSAPSLVEPTVRAEFADTAFWNARLQTDENGVAEVTFDMPENLTGWKIRTWALGHGTKVGEGETQVVTAKNLLLRLQAPRFFVEKDEVVLSANIHNYLETDKQVTAVLELDGPTVEPMDDVTRDVSVAANGEVRVDWRVKVVREGEITVRMKALTDEESDAMQMTFPVYVHGMLKTDSFSTALRPEQTSGEIRFQVPADRRPEASRLEVRYSPTLAGALVDALPYLADYPYGCTEQTLSRFLPAVLTQKVLRDMGVDLAVIRKKQANLNAQEIGEDVERAEQWKRYSRNPVFDEATLNEMVGDGLKALYDFQLSDGGWGWFSGYGERSWPHTTAYVVHGLQLAKANDLAVIPDAMKRGVNWLKRYQKEQIKQIIDPDKGKRYADNLDAFVCMVLVDADEVNEEMLEFLYRDRIRLSVYAQALLGLTLDRLGMTQRRDLLIHTIEQYLVVDDENQTAYLDLPNDGWWWYWYGSEYEAQAYYLKLLARTNPQSPAAAGLVKYLLNNRKHATYWNSTRDTAICIEAMAEYLRASGEDQPDLTIEILIDGSVHKKVKVNRENLFTFDNTLVVEGDAISSGEHTIEFRKTGTGPLYANVYSTVFSLQDYIPRAGLEIKVDRHYYRLNAVDKTTQVAGSRGQSVDQKVEKVERERLEDLSQLTSGDLIEVELVLESKNDYEYLVFEDMKPAGFEPVDVRSGYTGNALGAYVEFRDERVAFFVRRLARGTHSVSYRTRAEIPGRFSALPTRGYAMYAPELKANSDEIKLIVEDE